MRNMKFCVAALLGLAMLVGACSTDSPSQPKDEGGGGGGTTGTVSLSTSPESVTSLVGTWTAVTTTLTAGGQVVKNHTLKFSTSVGELTTTTPGDSTTGATFATKSTDDEGKVVVWVRSTIAGEGMMTIISPTPYVKEAAVSLKFTDGNFTLTSVSPSTGTPLGGDVVHIIGTGLDSGDGEVKFGSTVAAMQSRTATEIVVLSPALPAGSSVPLTVDVSVTVRKGQSSQATKTLSSAFTYAANAPEVLAVEPSTGGPEGGEEVKIIGRNLTNNARAEFGSRVVTTVISQSSTEMVVKVPPPATGVSFPNVVDVKITNNPGTSFAASGTLTGGYTYNANVPTVVAVTPSSGPREGGNNVEITGSGFLTSPAPRVEFGSRVASVVSVSSTRITVTVPAPATGQTFPLSVDVKVTNNFGAAYASSATLTGAYTYERGPVPTITSVSPRSGGIGGGNQVTITGTNFCSPAQVKFGDAYATVLSVSPTRIVVQAPAAPSGTDPNAALPVDVCILCPQAAETGPFCAAAAYVYGCEALPTISSISPSSSPIEGGTEITIFGSGFTPGMQAFVESNSLLAEMNTTFVSSTQLRATTLPINMLGGCPIEEALNIVVRNAFCGAESTLDGAFHYKLSWAVSSNSPGRGIYIGGSLVRIYGQGFTYPLTVNWRGYPQAVRSVSDTEIVIETSAVEACGSGSFEVCSVQFANCACASGGNFVFDPPRITAVSPSTLAWPSGFPANVVITGEGFTAPMEVTFAGYTLIVPAAQINADGTSMNVTLPLPAESNLNSVGCVSAGGCAGEQYVLSALDLSIQPRSASSCVETTTLLVTPDDQSCRVVPTTTAAITATPGAAGSLTVNFSSTSTVTTGSTIVSQIWDFGDGSGGAGASTSHVYPAAGSYTVTFTVTDSCGGTATATTTVTAP